MSRRVTWVAALLACGPLALAGQSPVTLDRVNELTRAGRTEEARVVLLRWWGDERLRASRSDVQRGLWLRGRLTVDPGQAELDFRRLVVEYPGGPFSGPALLRLAQSALAAGDSASAAGFVARLLVEYPATAARSEAEEWLADVGPLPEARAAAPAPEDVQAAVPAPVVVEDTVPSRTVEAPPSAGTHAVQLGAFASEERARALHRRAADAGLEPRLVRVGESRLFHVRVGLFTSTDEASELGDRIRALGFAVAVVGQVEQEVPVR